MATSRCGAQVRSVELARLAEQFLPSYLLPEARSKLLEQINAFPHHRGYYTSLPKPEPLQGDAWTNFMIRSFDTGERKAVSGIIISNSCDVAPENRALVGQRVVFAPVGHVPEGIVLLDNVHSEPLDYFWAADKQRLLRLSDFGFWLFVLKLSIHLTRLHEEVQRGADE